MGICTTPRVTGSAPAQSKGVGSGILSRKVAKAERIIRSVGNQAPRGRLNQKLEQVPEHPPRGMLVTTGEDVPRGFSGLARILEIEVAPGDIDRDRLTDMQALGQSGLLARGTGELVKWLAPDLDARLKAFRERADAILKDLLKASTAHLRIPFAVAELQAAEELSFECAADLGVISDEECAQFSEDASTAFRKVVLSSAVDSADLGPAAQFLNLLATVLASGRGHLICRDGTPPSNPQVCGWRPVKADLAPCGDRLGVVDGGDAYVKLDAALAAVRRLAHEAGKPFEISERTLAKRLHEGGKLVAIQRNGRNQDGNRVYLVKCTVLGVRSSGYLHMRTSDLLGDDDHGDSKSHGVKNVAPQCPVDEDELRDDDEQQTKQTIH
jgi:hypothetical protein